MAAAYLHLSTMGNPRGNLVLPYKPQTQHQELEVQAPASLLSSTPAQQQGTEVHRKQARVLASPAPPTPHFL